MLPPKKVLKKFQNTSKTFTQTFGHIPKGFNSKIQVVASDWYTVNLSIYTCRGEEPFVLKAIKSDKLGGNIFKDSLSLQYTIDF